MLFSIFNTTIFLLIFFKQISTLILDFSSVSLVDPAALKVMKELHCQKEKVGVQIFYVNCPTKVIGTMKQCNVFKDIKLQYFYPSIEHVMMYLESLSSPEESDDNVQTLEIMQNSDHFNEYLLGK